MRIAVNTRFLIKDKLEGIGWFTYETMKRITRQHPEHQFFFLFDRVPHDDFLFSPNITPIVLNPQARHPFLWFLWFECSVSSFLKRTTPDVFISPDGFIPLKTTVPTVSVIHDINFHHYPKGIPFLTRSYYNYFFPKFAVRSTRIFTVSEYSKNDITKTFNLPSNKVTVAHNGANPIYTPISSEESEVIKARYTQGKPYFVFVGALNPRKNVARLITAFDIFLNNAGLDYRLIIVGEPMFMTKEIKKALASISNRKSIVFTGRLKVDELRLVMGAATALTYTPYFEGFGIPLVEAMNCHIPIIASNRTSIPEVAGDAAYYVDPFDVNSIANAMKLVATNSDLQKSLSAEGAQRKKLFSWDNTAQSLYQIILEAISTK